MLKDSMESKSWDGFLELETLFPVILSLRGCERHGAKISFNHTLEETSKDLGTCQPRTMQLVNLSNPPYGWVLKCKFSDAGEDVYVPKLPVWQEQVEIQDATAFIRRRETRNKDKCSWLAQELMPCLPFFEVRFMCVNGIPIREAVTGKHAKKDSRTPNPLWCWEGNDCLKTLSALQQVFQKPPRWSC